MYKVNNPLLVSKVKAFATAHSISEHFVMLTIGASALLKKKNEGCFDADAVLRKMYEIEELEIRKYSNSRMEKEPEFAKTYNRPAVQADLNSLPEWMKSWFHTNLKCFKLEEVEIARLMYDRIFAVSKEKPASAFVKIILNEFKSFIIKLSQVVETIIYEPYIPE